jgi:hypothetical protein
MDHKLWCKAFFNLSRDLATILVNVWQLSCVGSLTYIFAQRKVLPKIHCALLIERINSLFSRIAGPVRRSRIRVDASELAHVLPQIVLAAMRPREGLEIGLHERRHDGSLVSEIAAHVLILAVVLHSEIVARFVHHNEHALKTVLVHEG